MSKAVTAAAVLLAIILIAPPLISLLQADDAPEPEPAEETEAAAPPAPDIPSPEEAPPLWDAQSLVGTAWTADFAEHADAELREMEHIQGVEFHFTGPGQIAMEMNRHEEPDEDRPSWMDHLVMGPSSEGTYEVNGPRIDLRVRSQFGWSEDTIEIRGEDLYFSGMKMKRINGHGGGYGQGGQPRGW